jgi:polar amino acid transport system substrate-binding protein
MQRTESRSPSRRSFRLAAAGITLLPMLLLFTEAATAPAHAATLDRIKQSAKITLGYRADARPFSYRDDAGKAAGYSVALCEKVVEQVKTELGLPMLAVDWMQVAMEERVAAVQQGKVDLMCGAETATLARRKDVSFSVPIFPSGIGALLRADAPAALRDLLAEGHPGPRPVWRGSPAQALLQLTTVSILAGTTSVAWLAGRLDELEISAQVVPVEGYQAGIQRVIDRSSDVFFGDRPILLDAATRGASAGSLIVLDRLFTYEPIALALQRNDDDFRLVVDRSLSRLFVSKEIPVLYTKWFGEPDSSVVTFFRQAALPE